MVQNLNSFCKLLIRINTCCLNVLLRLFEQDTFKEKTLNRHLLWMGHYVVDRTKPKLNEHVHMCGLSTQSWQTQPQMKITKLLHWMLPTMTGIRRFYLIL